MAGFVLDTTVLCNFASVHRTQLLPLALGRDVLSAPAVLRELADGFRLGYLPACDWSWLSVLELSAEEAAAADRHLRRLDRGEAECLALAESRQAVLISDDRAARNAAKQIGLPVSGTLGVLLLLTRRSHLTVSEANSLLSEMIDSGYRSPVQSLTDLAQQTGDGD